MARHGTPDASDSPVWWGIVAEARKSVEAGEHGPFQPNQFSETSGRSRLVSTQNLCYRELRFESSFRW